MGTEIGFGIHHRLHPEPATHIGICDADIFSVQLKNFGKTGLCPPNALTIHTCMKPRTVPFGITPSRFQRICDNTVVHHLEGHMMSRRSKSGLRRVFIPHSPIKGKVCRYIFMQCLTTRRKLQMDRQFIYVIQNHLACIPRRIKGICNNECDRFTDKTHPVFRKNGAKGRRPFGAIPIGYPHGVHAVCNPRSHKILKTDRHMHTCSVACIFKIKFGNFSMCD